MDISLNTFINQAVTLGEKSDKVIVAGTKPGSLAETSVGFFTRHSTSFQEKNRVLWQSFSASLAARFGQEALPPDLLRLAASGKPLTARNIIVITEAAQGKARMAAVAGLMTLLSEAGPDKAFLVSQKGETIADAYRSLKDRPDFRDGAALEKQALLAAHLRAQAGRGDDLPADPQVLGLRHMEHGVVFGGDETSVEDRIRSGALRKGDAIGTIRNGEDAGHGRYILRSLKTKGVEPGFLVQKNWLPSHETAMTGRGPEGKGSRLFQAAMGTATESMRNLLRSEDRAVAIQAFTVLAGYLQPSPAAHRELLEAVFTGQRTPAEALADFPEDALRACVEDQLTSPGALYHTSVANDARAHLRSTEPEFTETHVIKLDYNQSDRTTFTHKLRLPERIKKSHGSFFHFFRRTTVRGANQGAVGEALANDITRRLGIPAQRLSLIKGEYADGSPKLMLDSTYISGQDGTPYRDFDHFVRDGYLDRDLLRASGHGGDIRQLGGYKAAFLLLGDRDAVGSKGQNKGFVGNSFAAIDPGHSLEGSRVTVRDDFSFSFKLSNPFAKGFQNFSMFDDAPLSEKMAGWDRIEREVESGGIDALFNEYKAQFGDGQEDGRLNFGEQLETMENEFRTRYAQMRETLAPRLAIHRGLADDPPDLGPALLDSLENVEKLFSKTSGTSPNGHVRLEHLRVEERVAWDMTRDENGIHINCRNESIRAANGATLGEFLAARGVACDLDENGVLTVAPDSLPAFIRAMSEDNVRSQKVR